MFKIPIKIRLLQAFAALFVAALVCCAVFFLAPKEQKEHAFAETVTISDSGAFVTNEEGTVLSGISPEALEELDEGAQYAAVIPAKIERIAEGAFRGDTRLKKITAEEGSALEEIGVSAFEGCSSLVSAALPDGVTAVSEGAFRGCAALSAVYLPDNETAQYAQTAFDETGEFTFIAANYAAYLRDMPKLTSYGKETTYSVSVRFHRGEETVTVWKLHGYAYDYTQGEDGAWGAADAAFPNAAGYSDTVYFYSPSYEGIGVTAESISDRLFLAGCDEIDLYGYLAQKPALALKEPLTYSGNMFYVRGANSIFEGDPVAPQMAYTLSYTAYSGAENPRCDVIRSAGRYTISLNLDSAFGQWEEDVVFSFEVGRQALDLGNDTENLSWRLALDNSELRENTRSTSLYLYRKEAGGVVREVPFLTRLDEAEAAEEGYTFLERRSVLDSIVRYNGSEQTVLIRCPAADNCYMAAYESEGGATNRASEAGVYTATAVLEAKNDYAFKVTNGAIHPLRGLTVSVSEEDGGVTATVNKVWYIVQIDNGAVTEAGAPYSVPDWTYGDEDKIPSAPLLEHGDGELSFSLTRNGVAVGSRNFTKDEFSRYLNRSIPTGEYTLTVSGGISEERTEEGTVTYSPFVQSFHFSVLERPIGEDVRVNAAIEDVNNALREREFFYRYDHKIHFYGEEANAAIAQLTGLEIHKPRGTEEENVWASSLYRDLYEKFTISYNIDRMQNETYLELSDYNNSEYAPIAPDRYVVYYQISAPGYRPLVSARENRRIEYFFTVDIYEEVGYPQITVPAYDGNRNAPVIAESELFTAETVPSISNCDEDGHKQTLSFRLTLRRTGNDNGYHTRWALGEPYPENITGVTVNGATAEFTYEIPRAVNRFLVAPNLNGWGYDTFDPAANALNVSLLHGEISRIRFTVLGADKEELTIGSATPLTKFTLLNEAGTLSPNGRGGYEIPAEIARYLKELPAGTYYLKAELDGNADWLALDNGNEPWEFRISAAKNFWREPPHLDSWAWGNYRAEVNTLGAIPAYGREVRYWIGALQGEEYVLLAGGDDGFFTEDGVPPQYVQTILAELNAGTYCLFAAVEGTENYEGIGEGGISGAARYPFTVNKLTTQWEVTPNIPWWYASQYSAQENAVTGKATFGEIRYSFFNVQGEEIAFEELGTLEAGVYTLRATVAGDENHTSLTTTVEFKVLPLPDRQGGNIFTNPWFIVAIVLGAALCAGGIFALVWVLVKRQRALSRTIYKAKAMESTALVTPPAPRELITLPTPPLTGFPSEETPSSEGTPSSDETPKEAPSESSREFDSHEE